MLTNVRGYDLPVLRVGVLKDVLNKVVTILITGNVDQWNAWTVKTTLANTIKVTTKKVNTTNFEAFLNDLGGKLIHAILGGISNDMINCTAAISRSAMLADMLNAPIAKLAMSNDINALEDFLNAWTLTQH